MTSGTAGVLQAGAAAALREGEGTLAEIRARAEAGIAATYEVLGDHPDVELPVRPEGGMYVFFFFRLRGVDDARDACRTVQEKARVGLAPGHLFGPTGRSFLRMCILRETGSLRQALARMAEALR